MKVKGTLAKIMLIVCLLKDQQECGRTFLMGRALERRSEKAWGQELVSVGASVLNVGGREI